jgi:redox-sensitive bicupin YhaK (pirin superfamily)
VLQGSLVHQDSTGYSGVVYPGLAQRMSAGTGVLHSEKKDSWRLAGEQHSDPVHFVQMWVVPDEPGITPGYEQFEIGNELLTGGLIPVASGMDKHHGAAAIRIKNKYAACTLHGCNPAKASSCPKPRSAPGRTPRRGHPGRRRPTRPGDAVRLTATGGQRVTTTEPAEILLWEMHATIG